MEFVYFLFFEFVLFVLTMKPALYVCLQFLQALTILDLTFEKEKSIQVRFTLVVPAPLCNAAILL